MQLSLGMSTYIEIQLQLRPNFRIETMLRNAKICPSNLHEMRINKQTKFSLQYLYIDDTCIQER